MTDVAREPGDVRSRHSRLVGVLVGIALLVTGGAWALASPPGSSPDDNFHLSSIWCAWDAAATGCVIDPATRDTIRPLVRVPALEDTTVDCHKFKSDVSAACQFDPLTPPGQLSIDNGVYPSGFYAVLRPLASDNASASVVVMRLVVFVVCIGLLLWAGLLLGSADRIRVWLAWIAGCVPLGLFIFASTNPSATTVAGVAAVSIASFAGGAEDARGRLVVTAALAVIAATVAVGSRADAPFFLLIAVAAGVVLRGKAWRGHLIGLIPALLAVVVAVIGIVLIGGRRGTEVAQGGTGLLGTQAPTPWAVLSDLPKYFVGEYATNLGWVDVLMPPLVWASVGFALAGLALIGLGSFSWGKALALAGSIGSTAIIVISIQINSTPLQARYVLPLFMVVLAIVMTTPPTRWPWAVARVQGIVLGVALAGAQAIALLVTIQRYTVGRGQSPLAALLDPLWWWEVPVPPLLVWLIGSVSFAVVAVALGWWVADRNPAATLADPESDIAIATRAR